MKKLNIQIVEERAKKFYSDDYSFEKAVYTDSVTKIEVFCKIHSVYFKTEPSSIMRGKGGCILCKPSRSTGRVPDTPEISIEKANRVHSNRYKYNISSFGNASTKVEIFCDNHGWFKQRLSAHLDGQGCPDCSTAGYRQSKPGYLYILKMDNVTKIGITNRTPDERCKVINWNGNKTFVVLESYFFAKGDIPLKLETVLLKRLRTKYKQPVEKYDGSTECFYGINNENLIEEIEELIKEKTCQ